MNLTASFETGDSERGSAAFDLALSTNAIFQGRDAGLVLTAITMVIASFVAELDIKDQAAAIDHIAKAITENVKLRRNGWKPSN